MKVGVNGPNKVVVKLSHSYNIFFVSCLGIVFLIPINIIDAYMMS